MNNPFALFCQFCLPFAIKKTHFNLIFTQIASEETQGIGKGTKDPGSSLQFGLVVVRGTHTLPPDHRWMVALSLLSSARQRRYPDR